MKFRSFRFAPIPALIGLSVATLIALAIGHWTRLPFWGAFAIVLGAMVINGVIAQHEDDAPGGFNNPHPSKQPDDSKQDA